MCFNACVVIEIPGFFIGYQALSDEQKENVVLMPPDADICDLEDPEKIYAVNGSQLKKCLAQNDTSLVYRWSPNCSSESCILISACQEYCSSRNYKLYVVADHYDLEMMKAQNASDFPILVANHLYYKRRYANSLNSDFIKDLLSGKTLDGEGRAGRFLVFKGSELIRSQTNIIENQ